MILRTETKTIETTASVTFKKNGEYVDTIPAGVVTALLENGFTDEADDRKRRRGYPPEMWEHDYQLSAIIEGENGSDIEYEALISTAPKLPEDEEEEFLEQAMKREIEEQTVKTPVEGRKE